MRPTLDRPFIEFVDFEFEPFPFKNRAGEPLWVLSKPCLVLIDGKPFLVMREGFVSDRTSWPRILKILRWLPSVRRWLTKAEPNKYDAPAFFHDLMLEETGLPKWLIDWLYQGALRSQGVSALESWLFYQAVRLRRRT